MVLSDRWKRQFVDPVLDFEDVERFTIDAGDSLDVQQLLKALTEDGADVDLWKGRGLDPYGDEVAELGDEVPNASRTFLVKAGDIPLGEAELTVEDPSGSLNRTASLSLEWKNTSFDEIRSRVTEMVEDSGRKVPESLAKYAGASQVMAGGQFEVDRDIDDFDDSLRSFGVTSITFDSRSTPSTPTQTAKKQVGNGLKNNKDALAGALLGIIGLTGLAAYTVKEY